MRSPANIGDCPKRSARPLTVSLPHGAVTIARFRGDASPEPLHIGAPVADSFFAIHQLRYFPAHDFWIDGRYRPAPASPSGSTHIVALADAPCGRIAAPFDSLHIDMPRGALDDLARDLDAGSIGALQAPGDWATLDSACNGLRRCSSMPSTATRPRPPSSLIIWCSPWRRISPQPSAGRAHGGAGWRPGRSGGRAS
jgi:hypothetical protein